RAHWRNTCRSLLRSSDSIRCSIRFGAIHVSKNCAKKSSRESACVKQWEIIADNLHKAGWSLGWVSALDSKGRTIRIVDAHGYGKRFIVRADELLTAFVELQRAIHGFAVSLIS